MTENALVQQRHDLLTQDEYTAVMRHIDAHRVDDNYRQMDKSIVYLEETTFLSAQQVIVENARALRSILLSTDYPNNIREIARASKQPIGMPLSEASVSPVQAR